MLKAWRIIKKKHSVNVFDGEGSRLYGSRWTSPGVCVTHVSATLSLALLEVLVNLQTSVPLLYYLVCEVEFPKDLVEELNKHDLPENWRDCPAPTGLRAMGDAWFRNKSSVILRVPSVIIVHEFNYEINPSHDDFSKLKISGLEPLDIDPRLFRR